MTSIFLQKFFFFVYNDTPTYMPKQENNFENSMTPYDDICMIKQNVWNLYDYFFSKAQFM